MGSDDSERPLYLRAVDFHGRSDYIGNIRRWKARETDEYHPRGDKLLLKHQLAEIPVICQ